MFPKFSPLLTLSSNYIRENGAIFTATEIKGQPALWNEVFDNFIHHQNTIHSFLQHAYQEVDNIILTGVLVNWPGRQALPSPRLYKNIHSDR